MIIRKELVKQIKDNFNLNAYETKVWVALLSKGIASAGEVAELSEVPRSRAYDVLESLEKRGFAIVKIGKPVKYIAVKPTEVIEKMKSKTLEDAQERVNFLLNMKDLPEYQELEQIHKDGISPVDPQDISGSIKGRSNIIAKIRNLLENSSREILICTSLEDFKDKSRVIIPSLESLSNNKNIKIKIALSGDKDKIKKLGSKLKINIKSISNSAKIFISDKNEILFMTSPDSSEDEKAIWLQSPFFSNSLSEIIESHLRSSI
jgi:sugar-specific transcriptional regulator TrmB